MRTFMLLASAVLASVLTGCSLDKDFTFSIEKDFVVNNYSSTTYSRSDTVDASKSSSDYSKYKSDLKSLDIQSASYTITYFSGSAAQKIVTGTLNVGSLGSVPSKILATVSDVILSSVASITQPLTLTDDGKQYFKDQLMGSTSSAIINLSLTTNQAPISFTVRIHFDIKAKYSKSIL